MHLAGDITLHIILLTNYTIDNLLNSTLQITQSTPEIISYKLLYK